VSGARSTQHAVRSVEAEAVAHAGARRWSVQGAPKKPKNKSDVPPGAPACLFFAIFEVIRSLALGDIFWVLELPMQRNGQKNAINDKQTHRRRKVFFCVLEKPRLLPRITYYCMMRNGPNFRLCRPQRHPSSRKPALQAKLAKPRSASFFLYSCVFVLFAHLGYKLQASHAPSSPQHAQNAVVSLVWCW
jgi:hypothetical protein